MSLNYQNQTRTFQSPHGKKQMDVADEEYREEEDDDDDNDGDGGDHDDDEDYGDE